jgi:oligopeptide transport system ATP-binding protein
MSDVLTHETKQSAVKSNVILDVQDLKVHFPIYGGFLQREVGAVKAVDGVSFQVHEGETLGLVGESGCGKSTTGLAVLRMLPVTSGKVVFEGVDITNHDQRQMRPIRRRIQMVYQDPFGSLDPRMTVGDIIGEPLEIHKLHGNKAERRARVMDLLEMVGLRQDMIDRYPHQFSGGQRQRIGIARALAVEPRLLICDEPVSALDVSIQAQVVNLFQELQDRLGISSIFVAHDLAVVRHVSNRIAVMYLGTIVARRAVCESEASLHQGADGLDSGAESGRRGGALASDHRWRSAECAASAAGLPLPSSLHPRDAGVQGKGPGTAPRRKGHGGVSPVFLK